MTPQNDVNTPDEYGYTPLHEACERGNPDTARLLIDAGADVNARDRVGYIPLHLACLESGNPDTARLLLEHGTDVNARDGRGWASLHYASAGGHTDIARILLEKGAEVNVKDEVGRTPLTLAMELSPSNPAREQILDLFREHHPELVMEAWCTQA